jgi:alginate O-acetyltransferase complex protein AlgI
VYIPLGGNRFGNLKTSINLMTIFVLCGFWHGANFTFLVWGLFHGFFIIVERVIPHARQKGFLLRILSHLYVWIVLLLSWVFFRAENIDAARNYLHTMFSFNQHYTISPDLSSFTSPYLLFVLCLGFFISIGVFSKNVKRLLLNGKIKIAHYRIAETILLLILFYLSIIQITTSHFNPFIYYRF